MSLVRDWHLARAAKTTETWPTAFARLEQIGDRMAAALEARERADSFPTCSHLASWPDDLETQIQRRAQP